MFADSIHRLFDKNDKNVVWYFAFIVFLQPKELNMDNNTKKYSPNFSIGIYDKKQAQGKR